MVSFRTVFDSRPKEGSIHGLDQVRKSHVRHPQPAWASEEPVRGLGTGVIDLDRRDLERQTGVLRKGRSDGQQKRQEVPHIRYTASGDKGYVEMLSF